MFDSLEKKVLCRDDARTFEGFVLWDHSIGSGRTNTLVSPIITVSLN